VSLPEASSAVQPPSIQPEYLTREETKEFLRLRSVRLVDKLARYSGLPKIKLNRKHTLYPHAGIVAWLNQRQATGNPLPAPKRRRGRPRKAGAR
jgi:hypothetical protein